MSRIMLIVLLLMSISTMAQDRLSIFLDCNTGGCDRQYFQTELTIVDYSRDRIEADVHILLTSQRNGSGGRGYQMIFFGQRAFEQINDTTLFETGPNATDFERRDAVLRNLKIGLIPFLLKNGQKEIIKIDFDQKIKTDFKAVEEGDPWNYWVYRIGGNGNVNIDQNYESLRLGGNLSTSRITDKKKLQIFTWGNRNKSTFTYQEDGEEISTVTKNHSLGFRHSLIWSIKDKWAAGYEVGYSSSSFSNFKGKYFVSPSIEYNFFPYREVNNKLFTLRYGVALVKHDYREITIYDEIGETVAAEYLSLTSEFTQKWGSAEIELKYQHYLHDLKLNNLSFGADLELQVTGGLSIDLYVGGALVHDQIYLEKGDASAEDVLTRQRALQSSFEFYSFFGLNYRFGSTINNFVNPRFGSNGFR